ncbi:aldehyde dehydrogenase family protein [Bordetella petrii]|uniref:aldehyde dehydrogenase family protein n=1 Tax=Bordetella petrii TaxID=94624 RepID=UPI001A96E174|nr:aldehyde dehydrogenase family protein [Bordetella petrii]MBO1114037.1 aldehyde dehydrogenase family protein [Bordetella petrii]
MNIYDHFYADGRFISVAEGRRHVVVNPASETACAEVALCGRGDVDAAIKSARRGFEAWRHSRLDEREAALRRLKAALEPRADEIAALLAVEMGCPVWLGGLMQMSMPLKGLDFAIEGLSQITWEERVGNGLVERVPGGVVAAITPWNFPVHQIVAKVAAAVAAGCSIVVKPSEVAPGAAWAFMQAVHEAGLAAGVVNLVWGDADVGEYLVTHAGVDRISFTGSTAVGQRIMASAAARLTPVTLELGGKSAAVLLDDADLAAAIPAAARMGLANSGQACVSQSLLLVPRPLRDEAIARFQQAAAGWVLGDPLDPATRLGPVATAAQHAHVNAMIARAQEQGAMCVMGGPTGLSRGYFVAPTLFSNVSPDMEIARREVFGPVVALMTYENEHEAADLANASGYGLSGAVWSGDPARAVSFARRLKTGQVVINGAAQNLATPFGGWGLSGFGRENGRFGIEDMLSFRSLHGAA